MSSAPDSDKMPYELSDEEVMLFVAPLVGLGNEKPLSRRRCLRWMLSNAELIEFSGVAPLVVKGIKPPLDAQIAFRKAFPHKMRGLMPEFLGDFSIKGTNFIVTRVAAGKPPETSTEIARAALGLLELDAFFRKEWDDRPLPDGIERTDFDLTGLTAVAGRGLPFSEKAREIATAMQLLPLDELMRYPRGLIHGDPGIDNAFICEDRVQFVDGPGEFGPEIVDVAYLLQSAAACIEDFDVEPTLMVLTTHYGKSEEDMRRDLILADAIAHATVVRWFDRCARELIVAFDELYDNLIEERIAALEKLILSRGRGIA